MPHSNTAGWGQPVQQKEGDKRRLFKPENGVVRPPNGHIRPKPKPAEPRGGRVQAGHDDKVALAHEELRQLNLKKLQFLLRQEHRNADAVRRLMELVNSLCYFFRMLPKSLQSEVCAVMKLETYVRNEIVFTMGDAPDKFYIIASGKVEVCVNEVSEFRSGQLHSVAVLKAGDSFGEMALLLDAPRSATVAVQSTRAELLSVTREEFQRILRDLFGVSLQERLLYLRSLQMFEVVPTHRLEVMAHLLQAVIHTEGTVFDVMNDTTVYFVVEGDCRLRRAVGKHADPIPTVKGADPFYDAHTISRLGPGNFFGEAALFPEFRQEGWFVEAKTDCKFYTIAAAELIHQCPADIQKVMHSSCVFKFDYFKSRHEVLQTMDVKRKDPLFGMSVARSLKPPTTSRAAGKEGGGSKERPRSSMSPPQRSRLRQHEESNEGARADEVLQQLKQHILDSALELERQRLEVYSSTGVKPTTTDVRAGTSVAGTVQSGAPSRAAKTAGKQRPPEYTSRTEKEERLLKKTSYPRTARSPATNGAVESLLAAGGIRVYGDVGGEHEAADVAAGGVGRQPAAASPQPGLLAGECSGYMQAGGAGYIGYETKHTRASVASREQKAPAGEGV
eukprot:jgi/Tetstr1/440150/TSEL_028507.t1